MPTSHFRLPAKLKSSVESRRKTIASGNCDPALVRRPGLMSRDAGIYSKIGRGPGV
jgi:hypothetical protein